MISLRTKEGLNLSRSIKLHAWNWQAASKKYIETGLIKMEGDFLKLTDEGKLLADGIAAGLFVNQ
jgi:coproporphyrinogen III oxidase-like Fe-S oxidoreductase